VGLARVLAVEECVLKRVKRIRFPAVDIPIEIMLPIVFTAP